MSDETPEQAAQRKLREAADRAAICASNIGRGYEAAGGWGGGEPYTVLVLAGDVSEKFRPMLDAINDLAGAETKVVIQR